MRFAILFCAVSLFALDTRADVVTVTFDDLPNGVAGNFLDRGLLLLTAHTNPAGQIVNITGVDVRFAAQSPTPSNAAFGVQLNPLAYLSNNVSGEFYVNTGPFQNVRGSTNFVSFFVVGTVPGQTAPWTVRFYDDSFTTYDATTGLLGTITGTTDTQVLFTSDVGIRRFIFFPSGPNLTSEGIDTLQYNRPAIPEPTSLLLLGTGLLGTGFAARKRYRIKRQNSERDDTQSLN